MSIDWTYWQQLADHSGGVLYAMAGLMTLALTIGIERSWVLRSVTRHGAAVIHAVAALSPNDYAGLAALHQSRADQLHGLLLATALDTTPPPLAQRLDEVIMRHVPLLDRHVWLLDTTVTLAPLLGLLGTIVGMFHAFQVLAAPGTAPHAVTSGVAEALVATAAGLLIAVIGLLFFNGLNERVRLAVHQLDTLKVLLINRFAAGDISPVLKTNEGIAADSMQFT